MKKLYPALLLLLFLCSFSGLKAQNGDTHKLKKTNTFIYFDPEIVPKVAEIEVATYDAFFDAAAEYHGLSKNIKILRVQTPVIYDSIMLSDIKESCMNNDATFAVVPKIKFFKIGFGKYVLSSQVIVSLKLYNAEGILISENSYDTFRKKARILGSAENSVRLGATGAIKMMMKDWRKVKRNNVLTLL